MANLKQKKVEWEMISQTSFWRDYEKRLKELYQSIQSQLSTSETAPEGKTLLEHLVRIQGQLRGINRVYLLLGKMIEELGIKYMEEN